MSNKTQEEKLRILQERLGQIKAKKEFLPEITASLKAFAIKTGLFALAIALLIKTASQPISIATVASDAVPIPASTITGTLDCLIINEISIHNYIFIHYKFYCCINEYDW